MHGGISRELRSLIAEIIKDYKDFSQRSKKMKNLKFFGMAILFLGFVSSLVCADDNSPIKFVPGEILVKFKPGLSSQSIESAVSKLGAAEISEIFQIGAHLLRVDDVEKTAKVLQSDPRVLYAHPNYILQATTLPNDTHLSSQWGLTNINAAGAWGRTTGDASIVIAVVDTGVDLDHPDLINKIVPGYDFVNNDAVPDDDCGHGTHVAGIAAAETNNGIGIAGVSWNSLVMPVKVLNYAGSGAFSAVSEGIIYAADGGADIINLSLGGLVDTLDGVLRDAVVYAHNMGTAVIAAAGNDASPVSYLHWDYGWLYTVPAAYPECITVAATDQNDVLAEFSNYGAEVDIAAPGVDILSTVPGGYNSFNGTSMSTPFVSGLAALILTDKPWLSNEEVRYKLRYAAEDVNVVAYPGMDAIMGYGRINAANSVVPLILE